MSKQPETDGKSAVIGFLFILVLVFGGISVYEFLSSQDTTPTITSLNEEKQRLTDQVNQLTDNLKTNTEILNQLNSKYSNLISVKSFKLPSPAVFYDSRLVAVGSLECTGSMEPTIGCNDVTLQYKPVDSSDVNIGDVIVFYNGVQNGTVCYPDRETLVMHRVIQVISPSQNEQGAVEYETKGDHNSESDPCYIRYAWIEGKVYAILKQSTK